ncbi:hypothetical protein [Ectobacillus funiculus]|uniref:DUF559 domain-containing protein n=1 Tax=Ectobacillus funiculus TaxID=137993 RepID=A0ABV5WF49_9BACI
MFALIVLGMALYGVGYAIRNFERPNLHHHRDQNRKAEILRNRAGCSNRFEREMFDPLVDLGYTPLTQVKEARYRLDFVLIENGKKVCIKTDGEVWHDADHVTKCWLRSNDSCKIRRLEGKQSLLYAKSSAAVI